MRQEGGEREREGEEARAGVAAQFQEPVGRVRRCELALRRVRQVKVVERRGRANQAVGGKAADERVYQRRLAAALRRRDADADRAASGRLARAAEAPKVEREVEVEDARRRRRAELLRRRRRRRLVVLTRVRSRCCVPPAASRDPPARPASSSGRAPRSCRTRREVDGCGSHVTRIWSGSSLGRAAPQPNDGGAEAARGESRRRADCPTSGQAPHRPGGMHGGYAGTWPRHSGERGERDSRPWMPQAVRCVLVT